MRGPYRGELRRRVISVVEAEVPAVKRLNSSTSASVPPSGANMVRRSLLISNNVSPLRSGGGASSPATTSPSTKVAGMEEAIEARGAEIIAAVLARP
jgi:hypothetical protein